MGGDVKENYKVILDPNQSGKRNPGAAGKSHSGSMFSLLEVNWTFFVLVCVYVRAFLVMVLWRVCV